MPGGENFFMVDLAAICWAIWRSRNSTCFDGKKIRSPTEIVCLASSFLLFWTELQQVEDRVPLATGAEALKNTALHLHPRHAAWSGTGDDPVMAKSAEEGGKRNWESSREFCGLRRSARSSVFSLAVSGAALALCSFVLA